MKKTGLILVLVLVSLWTSTCKNPGYTSKKVVYVNSYHQGFPPSDQITAGVFESLPADSFELVAFFMDTKRNPTEQYIKERVAALLDSIRMEEPDILILSDDNAVKYLAVPHARDLKIPIVFCGVNWTADQYELPSHQVTGVLEILPVKDLLLELKPYIPHMKKVLVLNERTTTSRKTVPLLDTLLGGIGMEVHQELVDDFATWKSVFTRANESYDVIYLQTRGAIRGWDHKEALRHIHRDIQVPLLTCEEFMMPYAVFGLTQLSKEQGILAAEQVKSILKGASPSDIPVTRNSMSEVWFNPGLAKKIGFTPEKELLDKATLID
jgi:ABC-type uncharacterized transport system substrate-binding protein